MTAQTTLFLIEARCTTGTDKSVCIEAATREDAEQLFNEHCDSQGLVLVDDSFRTKDAEFYLRWHTDRQNPDNADAAPDPLNRLFFIYADGDIHHHASDILVARNAAAAMKEHLESATFRGSPRTAKDIQVKMLPTKLGRAMVHLWPARA